MTREAKPPEPDDRFSEVFEFRNALAEETDRGCALLAASYLDKELETLLRTHLVEDVGVLDDILRPAGPLGSFSARVDATYLLGLVGPDARRDLHLVRKIRNQFGHTATALAFEEPSIAARCNELRYTFLESDAKTRRKFTNAVLAITAVVHAAQRTSRQPQPAKDIVLDDDLKAAVREESRKIVEALLKLREDA